MGSRRRERERRREGRRKGRYNAGLSRESTFLDTSPLSYCPPPNARTKDSEEKKFNSAFKLFPPLPFNPHPKLSCVLPPTALTRETLLAHSLIIDIYIYTHNTRTFTQLGVFQIDITLRTIFFMYIYGTICCEQCLNCKQL